MFFCAKIIFYFYAFKLFILLKNTLFRHRIFAAIIIVNLVIIGLMAAINFYQSSQNFSYRKEAELVKLDRQIKENVKYESRNSVYKDEKKILEENIYKYFSIYNVNIAVYDIKGRLLSSNIKRNSSLPNSIIDELNNHLNDVVVKDISLEDKNQVLYNSYSYVFNNSKPIAILNIENVEDKAADSSQTNVLIKQYFFLFIFLIVLSSLIAWLISKNLTQKVNNISNKIQEAYLDDPDQAPLQYAGNDEIKPLVTAYNNMQLTLRDQAQQIKKNERAEAWKEMARQMAHEINNPLTPLKLTVQNFERKYRNEDPENPLKVKELTKNVVHQIDLINSIVTSFSDFAKMPVNSDEEIDMVEIIKKTVGIFPPQIVEFSSNVQQAYFKMDKLYLTRIITNIVKNSMQAIPDSEDKKIRVYLKNEKDRLLISITDNGSGISEENKNKIFEPNFTTKSDGMGLGLSMVKKIIEDYGGNIWFETQKNFGTVFFIEFIKNNHEE